MKIVGFVLKAGNNKLLKYRKIATVNYNPYPIGDDYGRR